MVEALIVSGLLVVFLGCVLFAHRLYSAKFATMGQARLEAWEQALPGCGGADLAPGLANIGTLIGTAESGDITDDDASDWLVDAARGIGSAGPTLVRGPDGTGSTFRVQTRTSVACNEIGDQRPGQSNLGNMWDHVRDLL